MYLSGGARTAVTNNQTRIPDVLEKIKTEFEQLSQETSLLKNQRDEFQRILQAQKEEMNQMQQIIQDFDSKHQSIKRQYEEEIAWLRRQIEASGNVVQPRKEVPNVVSSGIVKQEPAIHSTALPTLASLGQAVPHLGILVTRTVVGAAQTSDPSKAVDSKGRQLDDWNVVHNPNATSKMHIELCHTLEHDSVDEGPVLILQGHLNSVISVAHSPSSFVFATGSGDKRARIWKYRVTDN
ncbi:hypothetical protein GUITHDRAFT_99589 [Guillardia theta CCMP2712]|uniref:Transcriptional repressor Tup1 N-terminal domain-containing protein n=1 Tax=Guillardia theta (strain CCMP2712) TaxID=905079 RepID=L1K3A0_GUITC|nr:hypothetical protein GUITHDRAFT_99589 [Guillardia theta CCMP2712]EKX54940.1 hypothetical protein GUITHDRAFT_99589 [Guillardia theta CCMP2712]|eukprot:XP_005841920.1 hypothetical protein GUITHDRAFT_99589 [Guillardia theta CCMP2712]